MTAEFIHLRVHSEYSIVDSIITIPALTDALAAARMPAVALTDSSNLFAAVKFYNQCMKAGIKPILGADMLVVDDDETQAFRLLLLAQNDIGYRNLVNLVSRAYLSRNACAKSGYGDSDKRPRLRREWIEESNAGLLVLSGAQHGDVGRALANDKAALAEQRLARWQRSFGDRFYLEVMRTGRPGDEENLHATVALAARMDCAVVASNDVCFLEEADFEAHETRVCIQQGRLLNDARRVRAHSAEQYLKSAARMQTLFADLPEALQNSVEIAKRCNVQLKLGEYHLPVYPVPDGHSIETLFDEVCWQGLTKRLELLLDAASDDYQSRRKTYEERLDFEIRMIKNMGFAAYFLIVMEFINWAKQNNIPVGPGRGSGAASLVAYALGITELDPLAYELVFERLLNPERVSMPDFDVDFCMERRDEVIAHVAERYGQDAVSQIITFGTMAAKAVVRDVARVQGKVYAVGDRISKLIPFEVGMTLAKAVQQEPELRTLIEKDEEIGEVWEMACKLEGIVRNAGKHAAGVVIAPTKLTDFVPLATDEVGGVVITQFDKDDVEKAGLVKFDFLGLRTLTIIQWAVQAANAERAANDEPPIDINHIPLADPDVFKLLRKSDTTAVFQLESRGMKDLIRRLQPDSFEDLIALVALYRPGPMDLIPDFIERKHGRSRVEYPDPRMEEILKPTYGVMVYQEQVMQIAQVIGGYTLGGADLLRRAMGKKLPEEMAPHRVRFVDGAVARNVHARQASEIFDLMEKFAGYGFNKAHSACYALVAYQTAWLKAHYPAHFMAAVLSAEIQNTDKIVPIVDECRRLKLPIEAPDVNRGAYRFSAVNGAIVYGLGAIKGIGEGLISHIVAERDQRGRYADLADFCRRLDGTRLNRRALEAMIRAGAMDVFAAAGEEAGTVRARLLAEAPASMAAAGQSSRNRDLGIIDLFGETALQEPERMQPVSFTPLTHRQRLDAEKDTLGLFLSGHPIEEYLTEIGSFVTARLVDVTPMDRKQVLAGLIMNVRFVRNRRGDTLAIVQLDDQSGRIEVAVMPDVLALCRSKLIVHQVLIVEGVVEHDDFSGGIRMRADLTLTISEARSRYAEELCVAMTLPGAANGHVQSGRPSADDPAQWLERILRPHRRSGCPVVVEYRSADAFARIRLGSDWQVDPSDELLGELKSAFAAVRMIYRQHSAEM